MLMSTKYQRSPSPLYDQLLKRQVDVKLIHRSYLIKLGEGAFAWNGTRNSAINIIGVGEFISL